MLSLRSGFVVVGCVCVGFVASAGPSLVARAAEPDRWVERIARAEGAAPAAGEAAQLRIAQLEQQLKELEAERRATAPKGSRRASAPNEMGEVVARNQELVAQNRALTAENRALAQNHVFDPPPHAAACAPPNDADPKVMLRYWADQLRAGDGAFRARLTSEQNAAVNVLLRRERELDPKNPWRE